MIQNVSRVIFYVNGVTTFPYRKKKVEDPYSYLKEQLASYTAEDFERILAGHVKQHSKVFDRSVLKLKEDEVLSGLPTDQRLKRLREGKKDKGLAALYYGYGRYLLMASSRPGGLPANLQGIWCEKLEPTWDSKYTININLQMNYWLSWTGNLTRLHEPVLDLLETMHEPGKKTAEVMYGMRGMVCHHNTDYYGDCAPQDVYMASTPWVMGGAWMGMHVWEHYLYTGDKDILERMYPVLKDIALFYEDFLIEVDGQLLTCPAISPENRYYLPDGTDTPLCVSPAMDNQLLREFFGACIEIQRILEIDREYGETLKAMIAKLPKDQIGSEGQLMEWKQDYKEQCPGMGHVSHLYAV